MTSFPSRLPADQRQEGRRRKTFTGSRPMSRPGPYLVDWFVRVVSRQVSGGVFHQEQASGPGHPGGGTNYRGRAGRVVSDSPRGQGITQSSWLLSRSHPRQQRPQYCQSKEVIVSLKEWPRVRLRRSFLLQLSSTITLLLLYKKCLLFSSVRMKH